MVNKGEDSGKEVSQDVPAPTQDTLPTRAELFREYELCQANARSLESQLWQTAGVIGFAAIGTLVSVAGQSLHWFVVLIIGFIVVSASYMWRAMARRWWSVQHAFYMRMRHIETILGLYQTRYVDFLDDPDRLDSTPLNDTFKSEIRSRSRKDDKGGEAHARTGGRRTLERLPYFVTAAWIAYFVWIKVSACIVQP